MVRSNSNLTNNLGMPIRVDSVTNKPQWKDVGADTWNFFKSDLVASSFEQIGTLYVPTRTTVTYTFPSNYEDYDYFVVTRGRSDMSVEFPNMDIIFNTENTFWVKANGGGTPQYVFHNGDYYYTKTEIIYGIKS